MPVSAGSISHNCVGWMIFFSYKETIFYDAVRSSVQVITKASEDKNWLQGLFTFMVSAILMQKEKILNSGWDCL